MEYSQSLAGNPPLLGESLYVPKNLIELTPNEYAERSMTKISVLSLNMETPQRFDDVIQDQQKKLLDEKKKLLDEKPTTGRHAELLRKTLAPFGESGAWLLDAGCGAGHYLPLFRDLGLRVVGADFSPVILTRAREINPQAALEIAAFQSPCGLQHRDRSFDAIFCGEVIDHIRDVHWVLSEFNRVLRDGGLLIITTPYHGWIKYVIRRVVLVRAPFLPAQLPLAICYALQSRGISVARGLHDRRMPWRSRVVAVLEYYVRGIPQGQCTRSGAQSVNPSGLRQDYT